jgi:amino acid adenylation domain-containing protein
METTQPRPSARHDRVRALLEARAQAALQSAAAMIPVRGDPSQPAPLSAAQSRLWFMAQYQADSAAYNVPVTLRLHGPTDQAALLGALRDVADRHQVLRSVIRSDAQGPVTVPMPASAVPLSVVDTSARHLDAVVRDEARRPFALAVEPPMRAVLFRIADDDHLLVLTLHHVAFDDWSYELIVTDLAAFYAARLDSTGPPRPALPTAPRLQYADIAAWERSQQGDPAAVEWWANRLGNLAPLLNLPTMRPRPAVADWTASHVPLTINGDVAERLRAVAQEAACTPYMVLLAAWQALLGRLADVDDVAVGMPEAGRHHPETETVVGCFVNTVVARTDLSSDPTGRELLSRVRDVVLDAFAHSDVAFDQVVQRLQPERSMAGAPLVQVLLNLLEEARPPASFPGLTVAATEPPIVTTQFDLSLQLASDRGAYRGQLVYRRDLFDSVTVGRWASWFVALLDGMLADIDRPVSAVDILDPSQRAELITAGTGRPLPARRSETVVDAILAHTQQRPDAVAITDTAGQMTYAELAERSKVTATAIWDALSEGSDTDAVVGVCLPRDRFAPAALLGVLRAGAAYLPLEPEWPAERLGRLAADGGVGLVVSRGTALAAARAIPGVTVLDLDQPGADAGTTRLPHVRPTDLAYVLYTSGSTGRPKGVEITHANLACFVAAMRLRPGIEPTDSMLAVAPLTFDLSAGEIWAALAAGARCHVVDRACALDPRLLAQQIDAGAVTTMLVTPTTLRLLLAADWSGDSRLRVSSAGETMDNALAAELIGRVGELWNCWGPTETTIISTAHRVADTTTDTVPIGTTMEGEWLYIVDRHGRLALAGVTGELWIGGAGVARGYRGQQEMTAAAFTADPFRPGERCYRSGDLARWREGGVLDIVGRRDRQVKVRGYRIELGEIEAALLGRPAVTNAAVVVRGRDADAHMVGYVTPSTLDIETLQGELRRQLPEYLVPRRWMKLDALPLLGSGKVDRSALAEPDRMVPSRGGRPPSTDAELLVGEVWQTVLADVEVRAHDDFFALGGHSLAATRVAGRLSEALAFPVPVRLLFERPILADLAAEIERLVLADLTETKVVQ